MAKTGLAIHKQFFLLKKLKRIITCLNLEIHVLVNNFLEYVTSFWVEPSSLLSLVFMKIQPYQICLRSIFRKKKVQNLRDNLDGIDICQNHHESEGPILSHFDPASEEYVNSIILKTPIKSYNLDPIPTSLFSKYVDDLIPSITSIINKSLIGGSVPVCFKSALVTPTLDHNDLKNYRPVSKLAFF